MRPDRGVSGDAHLLQAVLKEAFAPAAT